MRHAPLLLALLPALFLTASPRADAGDPNGLPEASPGQAAGDTGGAGTSADVLAFVEALRAEASRIRGLEWKHDVPADVMSRERLREVMVEQIEKDLTPEEREREIRLGRRLRLLGPDEDPFEMMLDAMQQMVGGFYDPEEKKLFLIEGMTGEAQKPVILHELVHALEDQYYDLKGRMDAWEKDPDRLFAEKCLGEGSAEHASELYQRENPETAALFQKEQATPDAQQRQLQVLRKIPAFMIVPTLLHYQLGPQLVARAVGDDYPDGMNALYRDPPVSQEQWIHPDRYLGALKDYPQDVVWAEDFAEVAGPGWKKIDDLTSGELDLAFYLDFFLGYTKGRTNLLLLPQGQYVIPKARRAAAGWDGGRTWYMENEAGDVVWMEAMVFDTSGDAREAFDAQAEALKKAYEGEIEAKDAPPAEGEDAVLDYVGPYGPGRLLLRGTEILAADGVPAELFDRLWEALLATRFERDPRDTWDAEKALAAFKAHDYVDEEHGFALDFPAEDWAAVPAANRQGLVARAGKNGLRAEITMRPVPPDAMRTAIEHELRDLEKRVPGFEVAEPASVTIAGGPGFRYDGPGLRIYLGHAGGQSVIVTVFASPPLLASLSGELETLLAGIVVRD